MPQRVLVKDNYSAIRVVTLSSIESYNLIPFYLLCMCQSTLYSLHSIHSIN